MLQVGLEIPLSLAVGVLLLASTVWLVVRLSRRRKQMPLLAGLGIAGLVASVLIGGAGMVVGLLKAFSARGIENTDSSARALIVADGLAEAMNALLLAGALWIPSLLLALVVERTLSTNGDR